MTQSSWVRLAGLTKTYGPTRAVEHLDLDIAPGEVVALLGPNGAGKSTTIDMLLGLTRPDSGTVSLFGGTPRQACAGGRVGAMLQSGGLPPELTVRALLDLLRGLYPAPLPTDDALRRARIGDLADRRTERLSGGQRQRVRFACAVLPDPDLLVLDEPTAAMDVESRIAFWAAMREWAGTGRTVLFATHYLEEADDFADRVVVLRGGRVVADGSGAQVKALAGGRTVSCTLPDAQGVELLAGVSSVERRGDRISLQCKDSDAALRALLTAFPAAHDVEVSGAGLEQAFLALTGSDPEAAPITSTEPEAAR